jgi:DNA polymerase I-like protein with 3'-5' exonuclease and polymerase domains
MDTETMGLYPWYPDRDLVSISFTVEAGHSAVLYLHSSKMPVPIPNSGPSLFEQIKWLLTSPKVKLRGANLKFDLVWIETKWGIHCTNFKFDTLLVGSILDENRSNSLNLHAKVYTAMGGYDDELNSKYDKGKMEDIPLDDLLPYAGGDTDACHQVADTLRDELTEDHQLTRFYVKILHPAARAFEKIERNGIVVDVEKMHALREELRGVIKASTDRQLSLLPTMMRTKYRERIEEQIAQGKNPMLPSIVKEYFFSPRGLNLTPKEVTEKTKEPSLAKSHLRQFADNPDAKAMVAAMTEGDSASKTHSTFVDGFLKHLRPDGRFHPTFMLYKGDFNDEADNESGTNTGRLSAKDVAIQTLPKKTTWAKKLRECYPAPKGKVCVSVDYSQGELKVVACVAPEPTMINAYLEGLDLHAVTGAKLAQVDVQEFLTWKDHTDTALAALFEKYRGNAKPANFGLLYGMSAEGFQAYAWAAYGLKITLEEATKMRDAFFELYPGLLDYHDNQREIVRVSQMVRSPLGRLRHLPMIRSWDRAVKSKAERQAINSPIQSCLNDMMLWAVALIDDAYPNGEIEMVATIHDALIAYVPEQDHQLWAARIVEIMANLPLHEMGWIPPLKFTADAEAGPDLAHMSKLKLAA